jgi:hypothetical protein
MNFSNTVGLSDDLMAQGVIANPHKYYKKLRETEPSILMPKPHLAIFRLCSIPDKYLR